MAKRLDMSKYKRLAKIMQIVVRVFFIVSIVATVVGAVIGATLTFMDLPSFVAFSGTSESFSLSFDDMVTFNISLQNTTADQVKSIVVGICFVTAMATAFLAVILRQLELILSTVKDDKPFSADNSSRLTLIGLSLIIGSFILRAGEYVLASTMIRMLKLYDLSVTYTADKNMLIMGFIVLVLAGVFKYGCFLQNEYDSTV